MEKYRIADLVEMTQLSDRTIRNYIKDGRLKGHKVNGVWIFTKEELAYFFGDSFVQESIRIKNNSMIADFLTIQKKSKASMCVISNIVNAFYREK